MVFLLDGAKYHTGSEVRQYMRKLKLDVMWSAPYSYDSAPIETVFAHLKLGDLNPDECPTGKKVSMHLIYPNRVVFLTSCKYDRQTIEGNTKINLC